MSVIYQGYKWAAGFNNTASLAAVEDALPLFHGKPCYVHSLGSWDEGIRHYDGNLMTVTTGFQSLDWTADLLSDAQYNFIRATYCLAGGLSGEVTIRTLTGDTGSPNFTPVFANFNAVLQVPKKSEMTDRVWRVYRNVALHLIIKAAL